MSAQNFIYKNKWSLSKIHCRIRLPLMLHLRKCGVDNLSNCKHALTFAGRNRYSANTISQPRLADAKASVDELPSLKIYPSDVSNSLSRSRIWLTHLRRPTALDPLYPPQLQSHKPLVLGTTEDQLTKKAPLLSTHQRPQTPCKMQRQGRRRHCKASLLLCPY